MKEENVIYKQLRIFEDNLSVSTYTEIRKDGYGTNWYFPNGQLSQDIRQITNLTR